MRSRGGTSDPEPAQLPMRWRGRLRRPGGQGNTPVTSAASGLQLLLLHPAADDVAPVGLDGEPLRLEALEDDRAALATRAVLAAALLRFDRLRRHGDPC